MGQTFYKKGNRSEHRKPGQSTAARTPAAGGLPRLLRKAGILAFWFFLWQAAAAAVDNAIFLVGPAETVRAFLEQAGQGEFWRTLLFSSSRICLGFLSAFLAGILLGALSRRFFLIKELLAPVILLLKSVPVASFVILALIWAGSKNLSVFIAFTVVLPMIYSATLSGLESADVKLLEMAGIFRMPPSARIRGIYVPALMPYLRSSAGAALGLCVKSGVAAEVIGVPDHSIGAQLYMAKIYLSTADLFAWTAVILILTAIFEKLFLSFLASIDPVRKISGQKTASAPPVEPLPRNIS